MKYKRTAGSFEVCWWHLLLPKFFFLDSILKFDFLSSTKTSFLPTRSAAFLFQAGKKKKNTVVVVFIVVVVVNINYLLPAS
jgi:hypothetical protein